MEGIVLRCQKTILRRMATWTLRDDTRERIERVGFFQDREHFKKEGARYIAQQVNITFDHFYQQREFIIVGFEARAMIEQFLYYSKGVDLLPFGGDPSIRLKWDIAKHLEEAVKWYGLPITVLYFGDYDRKGFMILDAAVKDIREWCSVPINVVRCGLDRVHIDKYGLPENPEKPGEYQWEALDDAQAKEIIEGALLPRLDMDLIRDSIKCGEELTAKWRKAIQEFYAKGLREEGR